MSTLASAPRCCVAFQDEGIAGDDTVGVEGKGRGGDADELDGDVQAVVEEGAGFELRRRGRREEDKRVSRPASEPRMASFAPHQLAGIRCPPISSSPILKPSTTPARPSFCPAAVIMGTYALTPDQKERQQLKEMFEEARERCLNAPMEGVSFTVEDFNEALEKYDFNSEIGSKFVKLQKLDTESLWILGKTNGNTFVISVGSIDVNHLVGLVCIEEKREQVKGTVFMTDLNGALVDIAAKSSAYLPVQEACIYKIKHVSEAGIYPGLVEEFVIIDENMSDDSLILSLRSIQYDLAWERCRQLQAEDVIVKGKVVDGNKGGVVAIVEGLRGFVPFSQISSKSAAEELIDKELPLKFVEVDEEQSRLVLSNRKAMADSQAQLGIGSVVVGTVQSLKPYGAFIDIGGINGLLHVSQISHDRVSDISTVLQPGDSLKVMILSHDRERGRVSLSTKKLEPTPGDMIRNPTLVYEKADEMAQIFRQRIAQAEAMARADMLRFQPESGLSLSSEGVLSPFASDLPEEGLDLTDIPPAED
ncbi:hypothetical protein ZIOFF_040994 [Zingiber officinale]|uniref:S1 motif domain-containing protein n=1 Tax=Zingiber officinale TaxID=94328 RepID=A0A8J5G6Z8_ZINOF|nr:hypothetical protein ZIOFF_040994 [Zingiber officinale]